MCLSHNDVLAVAKHEKVHLVHVVQLGQELLPQAPEHGLHVESLLLVPPVDMIAPEKNRVYCYEEDAFSTLSPTFPTPYACATSIVRISDILSLNIIFFFLS